MTWITAAVKVWHTVPTTAKRWQLSAVNLSYHKDHTEHLPSHSGCRKLSDTSLSAKLRLHRLTTDQRCSSVVNEPRQWHGEPRKVDAAGSEQHDTGYCAYVSRCIMHCRIIPRTACGRCEVERVLLLQEGSGGGSARTSRAHSASNQHRSRVHRAPISSAHGLGSICRSEVSSTIGFWRARAGYIISIALVAIRSCSDTVCATDAILE